MTPVVSVILAVYNDRRHIERAVRSILDQTLVDFELILVDDGSTDGTHLILDKLARSDTRIRLFRQSRQGLTVSLVSAMAAAKGQYLARQDSDDRSRPTRFAQQVAFLDAHRAVAAVGTAAAVVDDDGRQVRIIKGERGPNAVRRSLLSMRSAPVHGSIMMRRELVTAAGGYRPAFTVSQDYDLWLRLSECYDIDNLPDVLYEWHLNPTGVYSTRRAEQLMLGSIAWAFARERRDCGRDSYHLLEAAGGDFELFLSRFPQCGPVHAQVGELLLRSGDTPGDARRHLGRALLAGCLKPKTIALFGWSACRLPWPGGTPMSASPRR